MIEPPGRFRLTEKTRSRLDQLGITEFAGQGNGLDGDQAIYGGIAPQIDDAHGAAPNLALQMVPSEALRILYLRSRRGSRRRGVHRGRLGIGARVGRGFWLCSL